MLSLALNETIILPEAAAATSLAVDSELYRIESVNTRKARIQSVTTDNGNEHTVQKLSNEGLIATKIAGGFVKLVVSNPNGESQLHEILATITLRAMV